MRKTCGKWLQLVTIVGLFFLFTSVNGRRRCGRSLKHIKLPAHTIFASKQRKANHVTLMCENGYYFTRGKNIKDLSCKILRNISNYEVPKCRGCGKPPGLRNGTVKYPATSVGSVAVYTCDVGFSIKGSRKQRKCRRNLRWSGGKSRISCQKNKCSDPGFREILNGNVTFSDTLFEEFTTISFECDENYELFGEEDIVCLHGSWSTNRRPFCRKKRCPRPDIPQHGRIFGNNFFIGSTVEFFCNSGFTLYGSRKRTCQDDKTWNGSATVCDDGSSYCRDPGTPVGAIKSGKDYNEGDVVYYTCKNGLKLFQGSQSRTCLNNKTWSGEPPRCVDKDFKVFRPINETAKLLGEEFVNSLLQTTCSGTNVSCPVYDTRARALNLKYKNGLDLIFVLDTSSSIKEKNFEIARGFVETLVNIFGVDRRPDGTRIACVTYGTRADVQFTFTSASVETKNDALKKIREIKYTRGGTATRLALEKVENVILPSSVRYNTTKAMFIVTDGESNVGGSPKKAADRLKNENVEIYVIGIGKKVRHESLRALASKDENIFTIESYKDLNKVKKKLVNMPLRDFSECGRSPFKPYDVRARIVGGRVTDERNSNWPWAVQVLITNGHIAKPSLCGGTLISQEFVLTAAHCVDRKKNQPQAVQVAFQDRKITVYTSLGLYIHPDYNSKNFKNDIALIKIPKLKRFTRNQQAICLPREINTNIFQNSRQVYVVGWGRTTPRKPNEHAGYEISKKLKELQLPLKANEFCEDSVKNKTEKDHDKGKWYFNSTTQFCAGDITGKNDACTGDSGGPAMVLYQHPVSGKLRWFQVGIVSWGYGCAQKGEAGFYTKVSPFIDFIDMIMRS
ncbi:complement factor B-like isoform X2 [Dendronephthya gigantea]|uniref:complement factor B-like isoform X2 n=1 Tax=Dendronephthya gigantea TaxID=151771 RepID=UPI0010694B0D|nr:complement factor B-like isoform X2 [Dendronephthya gigantea]XP_028411075.1 complement factor B-like isoform X2 [Dendronephthya gigantea]